MTTHGVMASCSLTLRDEQVAFTGRLASMSRAEAFQHVRKVGGRPGSTVTRRTTLLVVGMDGWPLLNDGQLSNKLKQAQMPNHRSRLKVWSEEQFLEAVGLKARQTDLRKSLPVERVCELVGITASTLKRWELLGLVRSHEGMFDFQDLVSLQAIANLISQGANPQTISRSVRSLARVIPGTDRPLAQLKLLTEQKTLLAEINGCLVSPSGQLHMRFDSEAVESEVEPIRLAQPAQSDNRSADELFELGTEYEEAGDWDQAIKAYREALQRRSHFPEANFNLANVLRAAGLVEAAIERLYVATEQDRGFALAWYNLADLLDEKGQLDDAIKCLRDAIEANPQYADAHYNLAICYQKAGLRDQAHDHWRAYLRLDSSTEWSAQARRELAG